MADHGPYDPDQLQQLIRRYDARHGTMNVGVAKTLKKVADGAGHRQLQSNADTVNVGRLRNAGHLTRDDTPQLTDDARYSLNPTASLSA